LLEQDASFRVALVRRVSGSDTIRSGAIKVRVATHLGGGQWPDVIMELPA